MADNEDTVLTSLKLSGSYEAGAGGGRSPVLFFADPQAVAMAGAQVALSMANGGTNQVDSNVIYADPGGADADLLLPTEALSKGLMLLIVNTADAAEVVTVKDDGDATVVANLARGEAALCICDGTTWHSESQNAGGAKAGATVTAVERVGAVNQTVLTLAATPITLTDDAGVGQYGGVKLYDMPAGNIVVFGAVVDAALTLTATEWTDAAEGDVGVGTTAVDDGDALATTEQNIIETTAIAAMTAQVGAIDCQTLTAGALRLALAGGTDMDVYINVRIDDAAAHITDGGTITGTVTISWLNLGDF